MRLQELMHINEIDYTSFAGELPFDDNTIISQSHIIGDIDGQDVWLFHHDGQDLCFFKNDGQIVAYIVLLGSHLRGVRNRTKVSGLVTALIMFVTKKIDEPLEITSTEPLTPEGFNWIKSLIKSGGRGLTVVDQNGNTPNLEQLETEWASAMKGVTHGPTSLFIEDRSRRHLQSKREMGLMPLTIFIGFTGLL